MQRGWSPRGCQSRSAMAGFLRRKTKKDTAPDVVVSGPMSLSHVTPSTRSVRQSQQPRRRPTNPPPSSYEPPRAQPAQQALAPAAVGDPYVAYRRSLRAPPPAQPESVPIPVDIPVDIPPRAPLSEPNIAGPALVVDEEDHSSHLIDLPPEIALFQVSFPLGSSSLSPTPRRPSVEVNPPKIRMP